MDTIIVIRDSVACCVSKTAEICQPCVREVGLSWSDFAIVVIICITLVIISCYAISRYFQWKDDERKAFETAADKKRKYEIEDRKSKQRADLEEKLLSHLKDLAEIKKDEDGNKITKFDENASNAYMNRLDQMMKEDGSKPKEQNDEEASKPNEQNDKKALKPKERNDQEA